MIICNMCRYWQKPHSPDEEIGQCRRYAPRAESDLFPGVWPEVHADEWCGEFERDRD